jgi:flagellar biosynthesis component FlhA
LFTKLPPTFLFCFVIKKIEIIYKKYKKKKENQEEKEREEKNSEVKKKRKKEEKDRKEIDEFPSDCLCSFFLANFSGCPSKQIFIYLLLILLRNKRIFEDNCTLADVLFRKFQVVF